MAGLEVRRTGNHEFTGRNDRGAEVHIGRSGAENAFSPGELLQLAVAACSAVTAEELITRRVDDDFTVWADAEKTPGAHQYDALLATFDIDLTGLDELTRARLETAIRRALDLQCTVSRTIKAAAPVKVEFE